MAKHGRGTNLASSFADRHTCRVLSIHASVPTQTIDLCMQTKHCSGGEFSYAADVSV